MTLTLSSTLLRAQDLKVDVRDVDTFIARTLSRLIDAGALSLKYLEVSLFSQPTAYGINPQ